MNINTQMTSSEIRAVMQGNGPKSERLINLDLLRIISILGVITIHITAVPVEAVSMLGSFDWWWANIFNGASRFAVPVFFMISGALMLRSSREESYGEFLKRRFVKIGIPFLVWSLFYYFFERNYWHFEPISFPAQLRQFLHHLVSDQIFPHLWFIYVIAGLYLVTPFLRRIVKNIGNREKVAIVLIWIGTTIVPPLVRLISTELLGVEPPYLKFLKLPVFQQEIGYFVLGYFLLDFRIDKKRLWIIGCITVLSIAAIPVITYFINIGTDKLVETMYDRFSIFPFLGAVGSFILFVHMDFTGKFPGKTEKIVTGLSDATFGIYFIHLLIQVLLQNYSFIRNVTFYPVQLGIHITGTFVVSFILIKMISLNKRVALVFAP